MSKGSRQMTFGENIVEMPVEEVMHNSMMPYAEYVIMERALPRVEDGLKPVQRRILYTMMELGLMPEQAYKKSARIVGDTLGRYHPHGDTSVYDAMVRMSQDFNMREPLVDGQGNFGSVDGDPAAAMRYTEAKLTPIALELLRDIEKDTVSFGLNFDDSLKEPNILPGRYPNLLVNGASGIAVGLATNIPPHNLNEVIDAVIMKLDTPLCTLEDIMQVMPGPDFPTGGQLIAGEEISQGYQTGRAKLTLRAKTNIEQQRNGKSLIVITELPYQVNKASMLEKVLKVSEEKKTHFAGISDIRDESDREGMRAVIELRKGVDAEKMLQYLFKYTDLQVTFGVNMVAIANGKPMTLSLLDMLDHYVNHQKTVVLNRTRFDLEAAKRRAHLLSGLIIALDDIDKAIAIIRAAQNVEQARLGLMDEFKIDREQSQAILDMRLQRLTGLEQINLQKEFKKLQAIIKRLESILKSEAKLINVIRDELLEIKEKHGNARRTKLIDKKKAIKKIEEPEVIADNLLITLSAQGIVKKIVVGTKNGSLQKTDDDIDAIVTEIECTSVDRLHVFTSLGNMIVLPCSQIPETKQREKGVSIYGIVQGLQEGEIPIAIYKLNDTDDKLVFFTQSGMTKISKQSDYLIRKLRSQAISLKGTDVLLAVEHVKNDSSVMIITKNGMSIRFTLDQVPCTGRVTAGVKSIALEEDDSVVMATQVSSTEQVIIITDNGFAKRSKVNEYELQKRNGKGIKTFDFKKNRSNGKGINFALWFDKETKLVYKLSDGTINIISTQDVSIEKRFSKGKQTIVLTGEKRIQDVYSLPQA